MGSLEDQEKEDRELQKQLKETLKLRDQIEESVSKVLSELRMSRQEFSDYLSNPNNFTDAEWGFVQRHKESLFENIWSKLGREEKEKIEKKKVKEKGQKRKRKMIGARKKWIQM